MMPMALQAAITENVNLRQGLPMNLWQCMGLVNSDTKSAERTAIMERIQSAFKLIFKNAPIDDAVDQMAIRYQHDALPPYLTPAEQARTVYQTVATSDPHGDIDQPIIELDTDIRLTRANILRLVRYKEEFRIYYHTDNSKEYHQFEEQFVEIGSEDAPAVEVLIRAYPEFVQPTDLKLDDNERNLAVAQDLWERGVLITKQIIK